jgi:hypothetical protein
MKLYEGSEPKPVQEQLKHDFVLITRVILKGAKRIPLSPPSLLTIPNKIQQERIFPCIHTCFVRFRYSPKDPV